MMTFPILCVGLPLLISAFVSFPSEAKVSSSSYIVTRTERAPSGQVISVAETVTEERRGEGDHSGIEGEVRKERSAVTKRFLRKRDVSKKVECALMSPPSDGKVICYYKSEPEKARRCSAICIPSYKFPDGSVRKDFNCTKQGEFWNKIDQPQDCQPAKPGIGCDKAIEGNNQLQICKISPERKECRSTCNPGYKFPDGETEMKIVCTKSTGVYDPVDKFPDCVEGDKDLKIPGEDETNQRGEEGKSEEE